MPPIECFRFGWRALKRARSVVSSFNHDLIDSQMMHSFASWVEPPTFYTCEAFVRPPRLQGRRNHVAVWTSLNISRVVPVSRNLITFSPEKRWLVPCRPAHDGQFFRITDENANGIDILMGRQSFEVGIISRDPLLLARPVELFLHSRNAALNQDSLKAHLPSISSW